jgi:hypothetical protein
MPQCVFPSRRHGVFGIDVRLINRFLEMELAIERLTEAIPILKESDPQLTC